MSNYNERLDEQLNYLMEYSYKYGRCEIPSSENPPLIIARQAKQAITSLIKELVAEARIDENEAWYALGRMIDPREFVAEIGRLELKKQEEVK